MIGGFMIRFRGDDRRSYTKLNFLIPSLDLDRDDAVEPWLHLCLANGSLLVSIVR